MKKTYKTLGVLLFFLATACNLDGDLTNPNEVSVAGADPNLIMNAIQLDFADFFYAAAQQVNPLVRHEAMTGGFRYQTSYQPQNEDGVWTSAYRNILINAETLIPLANSKKLTTHVAVAQILEAYTYLILVDVFGDVPQSEALLGSTGNFNPKQDVGSSVYAKALTLLDSARLQLAKTGTAAGAALARDIYYTGSRTNWTALANTLELKAQINLSMSPASAAAANARIAVLLTSNIIDVEAENFTYKYGTATVPNSRHPLYNQYYGPSKASAGGYINNGFMFELYQGKPDVSSPANIALYPSKYTQDPRWRYYFYRQVGSIAQIKVNDPKALGCTIGTAPAGYVAVGAPLTAAFCVFDPGFYGRDHGDASGTPPDSPDIVCAGVYPAGGRIDAHADGGNNSSTNADSYSAATQRGDGGNGAGVIPMFMSFYSDYMKAEISARAGNSATALTQLHSGITKSITQIRNIATALKQTLAAGVEPSTVNYLAAVDYQYANQTHPLDVIGKEFWIATWGNGIEAYNSYRRMSAPRNFQPTLQTNPGPWLRSMTYPSIYVNLNANAKQKDYTVTNKVFWDGNPDVLN